jgi:phenylalanine-4-hydroxylase
MYIVQDYNAYTDQHHRTWRKLFKKRMETLPDQACSFFLKGLAIINMVPDRMPRIEEINANLKPMTGWQACPVAGYIAANDFFGSLAQRKFPTTITIRPEDQLDYLPEPDMFHDAFGHVPLHTDTVFADFLQKFGEVGMREMSDEERLRLSRLFWFTVEFGLVEEDGKVKLYGSGLCSSPGEGEYSLTDAVEKRPFNAERAMDTAFEIDHYQPILYVAESFEQIFEAIDQQARRTEPAAAN